MLRRSLPPHSVWAKVLTISTGLKLRLHYSRLFEILNQLRVVNDRRLAGSTLNAPGTLLLHEARSADPDTVDTDSQEDVACEQEIVLAKVAFDFRLADHLKPC